VDKRYQVFVSSTYTDLVEERRLVTETLIKMGHIPAGMELFPAADEKQWEYIKRVIDDCDYYVLILGGRYGTTTSDGISYTEKEFDYAVSKGISVIALPHKNPEKLSFENSEKDPGLRGKLEAFREKVLQDRLIDFWIKPAELPGKLALALQTMINTHPAVGWVRADAAANEDVLSEIHLLRKEKAELEERVKTLSIAQSNSSYVYEDIAGLDDTVQVFGKYHDTISRRSSVWSTQLSWGDAFALIAPHLMERPNDTIVKNKIGTALFWKSKQASQGINPVINEELFKTLSLQFKALGLVTIEYLKTTKGGMALFWGLTQAGEETMYDRRIVRKES